MVEPVDKKRKVQDVKLRPSRIFSPFRVLGNVSNEVPFALGSLGATFYVVTSIGRSFHIYDIATLNLLFVSQSQTPSKITALAAHYHYVFAAHGNKIGVYKRGKLQHTLETESEAIITHIETFGNFLICTNTENEVAVFKASGTKYPNELHTTIYAINKTIHGSVVGIIHPPTYVNKVVVATTSNLFVININTGKTLFVSPDEQFGDNISAIEFAPILDMMAVGTATGGVFLYNIKRGRVVGSKIVAANEDSGAKVVSLSFRTDGSPHMVAGLSNGDLFFYDLRRAARIHVLRNAHKDSLGGIANAKFLNGQPIVVTNGGDNNLKEFVFDPTLSTSNSSVVAPPRHLRSRGGHSAPPIKVQFPQEKKSHFIFSASSDRSFWVFSLRKDAQAQEMSQRVQKTKDNKRTAGKVQSMREKFPEIIAMSSNQARARDWENIVTAHKDETFARTWSSYSKRVGRHNLDTVDNGKATAVCLSHCGNFALVGSSNGGIGSYNLQSGIRRKRYMLHKKAVTGICIDGVNSKMVSSGLDGVVGFYDFTRATYLGKLQLDAAITSMVYHKGSDLAACVLDDLSIVVIDVATQKVVRILYGHTNRISDIDFSPDGRWLVSVSLDATLRTWDLPTGGCIDGIRLPTVATSVKFSPLGDVLATTHVAGNGIFLWTNRAQFRPISARQVEEEEFSTALLPNDAGDGGATILDGALESDDDDETSAKMVGADIRVNELDSSLVTLSLGPRSKYSNLLHLDVIRQRSRPKEAPKKAKNAPFFLSLTGEEVGDRAIVAESAEPAQAETREEENGDSRLLGIKDNESHHFESEFTRLLREGKHDGSYGKFLKFAIQLAPATLDLEVRSLKSFPPLEEMTNFMEALCEGIASNENYEMYQALFSIFLEAHADVIYENEQDIELQGALHQFRELNETKKQQLDALTKYCSGVIDFVSSF